jgi:hypothetical protein
VARLDLPRTPEVVAVLFAVSGVVLVERSVIGCFLLLVVLLVARAKYIYKVIGRS